MRASTSHFLFAVSILSLQAGDPLSAHPVPAPLAPSPSAPQALRQTPRISPAATARLFADGSVSCTGADDSSQPVGTVTLEPVAGGTNFRIRLDLGASMAHWPYFVELSLDGTCTNALPILSLDGWGYSTPFTLDDDGRGVFTGFYPAPSGPQAVLVDVVSAGIAVPPDPRLREIAPSHLMHVLVPDDGTSLLTLGFNRGSGPLPWSEQGFTFAGDGFVSGGELSMFVSSTGTPNTTEVTLTRSSGGTFDAVALSTYVSFNADSVWAQSNLGGYEELNWAGPTLLKGPGWEGITELTLVIGIYGDDVAMLDADNFMVRIH